MGFKEVVRIVAVIFLMFGTDGAWANRVSSEGGGRAEVCPVAYLVCANGRFCVTNDASCGERVAALLPLRIYEKGQDGVDVAGQFDVQEQIREVKDGLFRRLIKIMNFTNDDRAFQVVVEADTAFLSSNWVIPCVMYGGNPFGGGGSPKGLEKNGEPWVFAYDRSSIPSCTLSENDRFAFSMFASDRDAASLRSACSVEKLVDGRLRQKIFYPVRESPVSYTGKNVMTARYDEYVTLAPGGSFEAESFFFVSRPRWKNYGYYDLFGVAFSLLRHDHPLPAMPAKMVEQVSLQYLKDSCAEYARKNGVMSTGASARDYTHPIGNYQTNGPWNGITLEMIEKDPSLNRMLMRRSWGGGMGFTSQTFMIYRMMLKEALRTGDSGMRDYVMGLLDNRLATQKPNGLISTHFPGDRERLNITELGWGASESVKIYALLKENGIERPLYLDFAKRLCTFFVENALDDVPFGREWSLSTGKPLSSGGCGGGFMVKAMLELHDVCGDPKYLQCAAKAFDAYFRRDLDFFRCTAGAIDCNSVDKESSFPFVYSGLQLYRKTGDRRYLDEAEKAATYFLSWMFVYDALYPQESEFARLGYHTSGGTAVSAEHQCIDPYASVIVPDLYSLSIATGNPLWHKAGKLIWVNSVQCVAGPNGCEMHGMMRTPGSQNECFAQARWTKYRSNHEWRGHLNDFIGIWLPCFKLYAIDRLGDPCARHFVVGAID